MDKTLIEYLSTLVADPNLIKTARENDPKLASLSDEEFEKTVEIVRNRLDKLSSLRPEDTLKYADLKSYPLSEFTANAVPINDTDTINLTQIMNRGDGVVTTRRLGNSDAIYYVFVRKNSLLYVYTVKDTIDSKVVLTLAYVCTFSKETIARIIGPIIRDYNKIFQLPEEMIARAEQIVCENPDEADHVWARLQERHKNYFEKLLHDDPRTILRFEVEPMLKN